MDTRHISLLVVYLLSASPSFAQYGPLAPGAWRVSGSSETRLDHYNVSGKAFDKFPIE